MISTKHLLLLAALIAALFCPARAADAAETDVVFKALNAELKRSLTLDLEGLGKPYFIQYAVDDRASHRVVASYGAVVRTSRDRSRMLHSELRVGSHHLDNSNFAGRGGRRGVNVSVELPIDDGYMALRQAIWRATDWQYKEAVETLTQKRAYLKDRNVADRPQDFTQREPTVAVKEFASLSFDQPRWENYVREISARFAQFRRISNADISLSVEAENRYLVNSEGSRIRHGTTQALLRITAEALANDGERLSDNLSYYAPTPDQLPSITQLLSEVAKLAERLDAMARAPILEDYVGPVLLDGVAAPQFFRQLLARGVAGQIDPVGAPRRAGAADDLESRVGRRILPPLFRIYDDPTKRLFQETFLAGHYMIDDEGVPAQRVEIVVDGKLQGMVMSRTPTRQFGESNGHGRRAGGDSVRATIGCLYIEPSKGETPDDLKKELIDAADGEGLKFGLRISSLQNRAGGPPGFAGFGGRFGRGGGPGGGAIVGEPLIVHRVYVADGREEPVRGCEFSGIDIRSLRRIIAAGNALTVHNSAGAGAPSSVIAPAVLFEELELSRVKTEPERKPIVAAPHTRN